MSEIKENTRMETVVIEAVNTKVLPKFARFNAGGILVNGKWMNVKKGVDMKLFQKGQKASLEIETDGNYDKVVAVNQVPLNQNTALPDVPSLPKTSVAPKSNPDGVSPVAGVKKRINENGNDGMTKQDWAARQDGISIDAIHKSVLESPTLANLAIGKSEVEVLETVKTFLKYNLDLNQRVKRGEM